MRLRHKTWTRRWLAFLSLSILLITVALPPTLTLALQTPPRVGRIDLLWGTPETGNGTAVDYLSGSVVRQNGKDVNKPVAPATGKPAPHIEYADVIDLGPVSDIKGVSVPTKGTIDNPLSVLGKRWVLGPAQLVPGGFGALQCAGPLGCLEPTGRKVVNLGTDTPDEFKLVLVKISPDENTATFEAYVRACIKLHGKWITCTPYSIATAFLVTLPVNATMPIDIAVPAFGFKLSPTAAGNIKNVLSKANLKQIGFQAAGGVVSSIPTGGGGGSGGGGSRSSQPQPGSATVDRSSYGSQIIQSKGGLTGVGTGHFTSPVPVLAPTSGQFWDWRTTPKPHHHLGTDLVVPDNTPILAADGGTAYNMENPGGYGHFIVIDHGNGYGSVYAHLTTSQVASGQRVAPGQQVGLSGHGGDSTGPHLHFEIIEGMTPGDPYTGHAVNAVPFIKHR
jgi:murein DD-endopeptidase MepM/ murein hydrolase activator NlpD